MTTNETKSIVINDMMFTGKTIQLLETGYLVAIIVNGKTVAHRNFSQQGEIRYWMKEVVRTYPFVQIVTRKQLKEEAA